MDSDKGVWRASGVYAPDYPRQSSGGQKFQASRSNRVSFADSLQRAIEKEMPGYYSVYSFPNGHSRDGNIPNVDCIFIDLDLDGDSYDPKNGETGFEAWRRDMSALLSRARMIARAIIDGDQAEHFRVTLSGHKGLHLYLDFPAIGPNNGTFEQFKNGLKEYGEQVMTWLNDAAGGVNIEPWVDVDASDLGRLARHPNTINHGAKYDSVDRWCVPVTMSELADLHVDDYLELTREPRWSDGFHRVPSTTAGEKVTQAIRTAATDSSPSRGRTSTVDYSNVDTYEENEDIELEDIPFITANYPCIQEFAKREDAWDHGNASHLMEVNVIGKLIELNVPRDVIHEFFEQIPGYSEQITDNQIDQILAREYKSFNCSKLAAQAKTFCLGEDCTVYQKYDDIQK
jgi:hypothetical protein